MSTQPPGHSLELIDLKGGRCQAILRDGKGKVLLDRDYKSRHSASQSVRWHVNKMGLGKVRLARAAEPEAEVPSLLPEVALEPLAVGPGVSTARDLLLQLREASQAALTAVVALRAQADALEADYKRLSAAADILEGPEGD
jgi:hypothetical protein